MVPALVLAGAAPLAAAAPARHQDPVVRVVAVVSLDADVLTDLNQLRREHGLVPLRFSPALAAAAREHSESMATKGYFAHDSADGTSFSKRVRHFYAPRRSRTGTWWVGENLLWSSPDVGAESALQMWLNSPPHRANLLAPRWREIGIAAVHADPAPGFFAGRPVTILTADFGVR